MCFLEGTIIGEVISHNTISLCIDNSVNLPTKIFVLDDYAMKLPKVEKQFSRVPHCVWDFIFRLPVSHDRSTKVPIINIITARHKFHHISVCSLAVRSVSDHSDLMEGLDGDGRPIRSNDEVKKKVESQFIFLLFEDTTTCNTNTHHGWKIG